MLFSAMDTINSLLLIILQNGALDKDFNKNSKWMMDFGPFGTEINLGKSIRVSLEEVQALMAINQFI